MKFTIYARGATRFGEVLKPRTEIGYFGNAITFGTLRVARRRYHNGNPGSIENLAI
ncbi:hypothetical protein [uncultured Nostoc sp.]|uniref:hypothetical protein n=1 Tax=uncultured Nostoc sp. TaxID=340711 RepID=UPI0035CB174A